MKSGCIICSSDLEYLNEALLMECEFCNKVQMSKSRCINGHYICDECHTKGLNKVIDICLNEKSINPIEIINKIMKEDFCHMHGPEHHTIVGASLLTAYYNAGGEINIKDSLIEMIKRSKEVPGGVCGYWGACGAGISSGIFISIISESTPLSTKPFKLSNKMTSKSLSNIADFGGPRCCKRDSYLSILTAIDFVKDNFGIELEKDEVICKYSNINKQCIKELCPFFNSK